ncbi:MAG: hypothetical protein SPJ84_06510 [Fusobacterium gastrosuis]|uniref:hypothetical protein n=1 Tax=Fusobacterium gastrosuis TaxID=1755100 RepID=UPI002A9A2638|nr:hypothetical protein [Fusobacterium gastrosuis]
MDNIIEILRIFGYTVGEEDKPLLAFIKTTVENSIKIRANITKIPKELEKVIEKRVIGEFLATKLSNGGLENSNINLEPIVKSIQEGKVNITYETESQDKTKLLTTYCGMLIAYGEHEIITFRKLRW